MQSGWLLGAGRFGFGIVILEIIGLCLQRSGNAQSLGK